MNKATLKALEGSIEKWHKIVIGTGIDEGIDNCPLCKMFFHNTNDELDTGCCAGCPVRKHTGHPNCARTPYGSFRPAVEEDVAMFDEDSFWIHDYMACGPRSIKAAIDEYNFLYSLLP